MPVSSEQASMTTLSFKDQFEHHLRAFIAASDRVRHLMIIIIIACVIVFSGTWNSFGFGWQLSRYDKVQLAIKHELWRGLPETFDSPEDEQEIRKAKDYIEAMGIHDEESLQAMYYAMVDSIVQNISMVAISFLGVKIDVNDLGIVGGFALTVLMCWLVFSLYQLGSNMELSRLRAEGIPIEEKRKIYEVFVMRQVLNTPPTRIRPKSFWRSALPWLPRLVYVLPLLVHLAVFWHDRATAKRAALISPTLGSCIWTVELAWLLWLGILTFLAFQRSRSIDRIWVQMYEECFEQPEDHGKPARETDGQ